MAGLDELARRLNLSREKMLAQTQRLVHGTTVATNALLERKGAKVALLTTEGHRDVLEMREGLKGNRYDLRSPPPEPLVPRELRFGVRERLKAGGEVSTPLDEASLGKAIAAIKEVRRDLGRDLLPARLSQSRPRDRGGERLARELPEVSVSRSSDVLPQIKEYERVSTTVVNAYVRPIVRHYLERLEKRLTEAGFKGSLFIILSHGGMAPVEEAARLAAATVLSGPAGGMSGCRRCAAMLGIPDLVAFDMGGTSTDISLIADGSVTLSADGGLAGERIALRSLDISSIAAGGGSIASVDSGGIFHVGPQSAGAMPGPACYGQGGTAPTVTDANVVLGYLDRRGLHGRQAAARHQGRGSRDRRARRDAQDHARRGGGRHLPAGQSQDGRRHPSDDPAARRRSPAVCAVELWRRRGPACGRGRARAGTHAHHRADHGLGAVGLGHADQSDLRYEVSRTHFETGARSTAGEIRDIFAELETRAVERLRGWFDGPIQVERSAEMRYGEQIFEIDVPLRWHRPQFAVADRGDRGSLPSTA